MFGAKNPVFSELYDLAMGRPDGKRIDGSVVAKRGICYGVDSVVRHGREMFVYLKKIDFVEMGDLVSDLAPMVEARPAFPDGRGPPSLYVYPDRELDAIKSVFGPDYDPKNPSARFFYDSKSCSEVRVPNMDHAYYGLHLSYLGAYLSRKKALEDAEARAPPARRAPARDRPTVMQSYLRMSRKKVGSYMGGHAAPEIVSYMETAPNGVNIGLKSPLDLDFLSQVARDVGYDVLIKDGSKGRMVGVTVYRDQPKILTVGNMSQPEGALDKFFGKDMLEYSVDRKSSVVLEMLDLYDLYSKKNAPYQRSSGKSKDKKK